MDTREFQAPASIEKRLEDFFDAQRSDEKVRTVWNTVQPLLVQGERVEHLLIQGLTAVKFYSGAVVLTNRRAIFLQPGMMKMTFLDMVWRRLQGVHINESLTGAEILLQAFDGRILRMGHLPKDATRRAYAFAQQLEEGATEFRRQRAMEEARAAAKGFAVPPPISNEPPLAPKLASAPYDGDPAGALATLKDMRQRDLIDEETYQAKRAEILARL